VTVADASGDNRRRVAEVADVVIAGTAEVDLQRALDALYERGARSVLVEGGPTLTGYLANAGLIDELCVTLAPWLVGGEAKRLVAGSRPEPPLAMELRSLCEEDGYLFLRYRSSS
jgi:5-amino-6-(5-phosphoribosylamino)uracil reductase